MIIYKKRAKHKETNSWDREQQTIFTIARTACEKIVTKRQRYRARENVCKRNNSPRKNAKTKKWEKVRSSKKPGYSACSIVS